MSKKNEENSCCGPLNMSSECCRVESVVTIDSKGQILLPKELRKNTGLDTGDRLVVVSMNANTDSPIMVLMKADNFGNLVRNFLGPVMKDLISSNID